MPELFSNSDVVKYRPSKIDVDPYRPYLFLHEQEIQQDGEVYDVNTIFLTNRECPFKCLMCDLWRHTLDAPTPDGAIPEQIDFALRQLPKAHIVKLYNSGNFFDGKAIPKSDYVDIARLLSGFSHVIVENHPKLIGPFIPDFSDMLDGTLEIAMGLETVHPVVLPKLNKQITARDFKQAAAYLVENSIAVRAFILLNPPFLTDSKENYEWCLKSVRFAFDSGAECCTIIPTREGNGIMEKLKKEGSYIPPTLKELEDVFDSALDLNRGRVFCDTWDLQNFSNCKICFADRKTRLESMNISQKVLQRVECSCIS